MNRRHTGPRKRWGLTIIRNKLGIVATDEQGELELRTSGWEDVWIQATCFYWRIWIGPRWVRLAWYEEIRLRGMPDGSLRALLEHVFRPRKWNHRLALWHMPRKARGGRGLIVRKENGWEVIG